jgi:hypothetical protein
MAGQISYYFDEQVPSAVAKALRLRDIDVLTTQDAGMLGASDKAQLAFALANGRVLFTQDDDFLRLHADKAVHFGIVYAHQRAAIGYLIRSLQLIAQVITPDEMRGHVEFL